MIGEFYVGPDATALPAASERNDPSADAAASSATGGWDAVAVGRPSRCWPAASHHDDTTTDGSTALTSHRCAATDDYAQSATAGHPGATCWCSPVRPGTCNTRSAAGLMDLLMRRNGNK